MSGCLRMVLFCRPEVLSDILEFPLSFTVFQAISHVDNVLVFDTFIVSLIQG